MTMVTKTEAPERETELDRLVAKLRTALRHETTNIIEIGKLLIEIRKHVHHGEWQDWLAKNFDLSYRSARNYISAAEYVESKSATVALLDFENLSPTVLYWLAAGCNYNEQEEAAILAATCKGRVDFDAVRAICEKLALAKEDGQEEYGEEEYGGELTSPEGLKDPEIVAILDGPSPAVPETAAPPRTNFALQDFDNAISMLKRVMTKSPTQFAQTSYSTDDLELVAFFIHAVMNAMMKALKCPTR